MCLSFSGFGIAEAGKRRMRSVKAKKNNHNTVMLFLHCYAVAKVY